MSTKEEIPTTRNPRHKRPTHAYRATLKKATVADYRQLEKACLVALLSKVDHVILAVSYLTKWPSDFPKGVLLRSEGLVDYRKIRAVKLMQWLRDKGYTTITSDQIWYAGAQLTNGLKEKFIL